MKRTLSLFLLLSLALTSLSSLAACQSPTGSGGGGGAGVDVTFLDHLDEYGHSLDFSAQEEFVISYRDLYEYEVYGPEDSNEKIDTLIHNRNTLIEARFGVEISRRGKVQSANAIDFWAHHDYVQGKLNSGDVDFDAIAMYASTAGRLQLGNGGNFLDFRSEVPYCSDSIQKGEEWWPTDLNTASTVMGRQFVAVSDFAITAVEMAYAVIFNKDLAKSENVANTFDPATYTVKSTLYDLVRNNDWTLENMKTIVKGFYRDNPTSGKPKERDAEDRYGLIATGGTDADAWCYALGFCTMVNDGVSAPSLWEWNGRQYDAILSLRELYNANGTWSEIKGGISDDYNDRSRFFAQKDHVLFELNILESLKYDVIHQMEQDYGVLPFPKYDENQAKFLSGSIGHYTALAVPYTIVWDMSGERLRMTGALLEALSAENCNSVKKPYYDDIVTHHNVTDGDSVEMINLIMDGRVYDLGVYHMDDLVLEDRATPTDLGFAVFFRHLLKHRSKDIVQYWQSNSGSLETQLDNLLNSYASILG